MWITRIIIGAASLFLNTRMATGQELERMDQLWGEQEPAVFGSDGFQPVYTSNFKTRIENQRVGKTDCHTSPHTSIICITSTLGEVSTLMPTESFSPGESCHDGCLVANIRPIALPEIIGLHQFITTCKGGIY